MDDRRIGRASKSGGGYETFAANPGDGFVDFALGMTLFSGIPALILRTILHGYRDGRSVFDHRSFKHDRRLFANPKATNFEIRLARVREKLAKATRFARIEKYAEGRFAFVADCPLELRESQ